MFKGHVLFSGKLLLTMANQAQGSPLIDKVFSKTAEGLEFRGWGIRAPFCGHRPSKIAVIAIPPRAFCYIENWRFHMLHGKRGYRFRISQCHHPRVWRRVQRFGRWCLARGLKRLAWWVFRSAGTCQECGSPSGFVVSRRGSLCFDCNDAHRAEETIGYEASATNACSP